VPPKQSAILTEAELRIMDVLWRKGSGTVQQVLDWLPSTLAYNSVLTTTVSYTHLTLPTICSV